LRHNILVGVVVHDLILYLLKCCRWSGAAYSMARVYADRFSRLNTDQTASFLSVGEHDNFETMLAELSAWLPA
jgi:hypothetical protein